MFFRLIQRTVTNRSHYIHITSSVTIALTIFTEERMHKRVKNIFPRTARKLRTQLSNLINVQVQLDDLVHVHNIKIPRQVCLHLLIVFAYYVPTSYQLTYVHLICCLYLLYHTLMYTLFVAYICYITHLCTPYMLLIFVISLHVCSRLVS